MRFARSSLVVASALLLSLGAGCPSRAHGDDDDDDDDGGIDDGDGGGDPCPNLMCCPGKNCPGGFMCEPGGDTCEPDVVPPFCYRCVSDPCGGAACCDERPCVGDGLECVAGQCVPIGTLGAPCDSDLDCNGPDAQCLFAAEGWPEGYCIQSCVEGSECPGDGVCVGASCFDGCFVLGDCRLGYTCREVPGGMSCSPE